jgi:hypothetical protein
MVDIMLSVRVLRGARALAVLCCSRLCAGASVSELDLPAEISISDTTQLLRINGLDVRSRPLTSALAPNDACALFEQQWKGRGNAGPPVQCQRVGRWLVITRSVGKVFQTAQLEATGHGSVGFLSAVDPLAVHSSRPRVPLPLPVGARVVNVVQSIEAGDAVTQFTLLVSLPPAATLLRLRTAALARGWGCAQAGSEGVVDFQRGAVAVRAYVTRTPLGTGLVLVEHEQSGMQP